MNLPTNISVSGASPKCVYMLSDGHRIKIGTTTNLDKRVSQLSGACGVRLSVIRVFDFSGPRVEKWLHKKFASYRQHGEWFLFCDEMLTVVPPEEPSKKEVVTVLRDVRLTVKEHTKRARERGGAIGISDRDILLTLVPNLTDEIAAKVLAYLETEL